ncbi:MAG: acyl carrier protein [Acidobacteria bacterium]|nr:acyl carrier protein [Acidobacteriota bacterium]
MTAEAVLAGIAEVAREHLDWQGPIRREMLLVEDLELDSLRLFTLAAELENHFRIHLYEDEEGELSTVGDLVDLIRSKLGRA